MAENIRQKKELNPLTEEEVDALADKFTASWESGDPSANAEVSAPTVPEQPLPPRTSLKRTMLGLPVAPPPPPEPSPAESETEEGGTIPRQKTLLGIQAPDDSEVRRLVERYKTPIPAVVAPTATAPASEAPASTPRAAAPEVPKPASTPPRASTSPKPLTPRAARKALSTTAPLPTAPANKAALSTTAPLPTAPSKAALSTTAPLPTAPASKAALSTTAPLLTAPVPDASPAVENPSSFEAAPTVEQKVAPMEGPGLLGWGASPIEPPTLDQPVVPASPPPNIPAKPAFRKTAQGLAPAPASPIPEHNPAPAAQSAIAHGPEPVAPTPPMEEPAVEVVFPSEPTLPTGVEPNTVQTSYAPPAAPPQPVRIRSQEEPSVVVDDGVEANAVRLAQRADTLPPQRIRHEDIVLPPELQKRSGKTLWVALGLVAVVAVGSVVAMSGGDVAPIAEQPPSSPAADNTATAKAKAEAAPASDTTEPSTAEPSTAEPSEPTASADETQTLDSAEVEPPKPVASLKPKVYQRPQKLPAQKAKATETRKTQRSKSPKSRKPKTTSKTIVRDAPF